MTVSDPGAGQQQGREVCELSQRVDGKLHSWRFDGDDPYVICHYCGRVQDALTGRVIDEGRNAAPSPASHPSGLSPFPSPTPPARDSGRDEAREAVARSEMIAAIRAAAKTAEDTPCDMDVSGDCADRDCPSCSSPVLPFATRGGVITSVYADVEELVDLLLALPELDKLLRRPA